MKVIVVESPSATETAARLCFDVGFMEDHPNIQGLAHFFEHMVAHGYLKAVKENSGRTIVFLIFLYFHALLESSQLYILKEYTAIDIIPFQKKILSRVFISWKFATLSGSHKNRE